MSRVRLHSAQSATWAPHWRGTKGPLPASRTSGYALFEHPPASLWAASGGAWPLAHLGDRAAMPSWASACQEEQRTRQVTGAFRNHAGSRVLTLVFEEASVTAGQQEMSAQHDPGPQWTQPRDQLCLWRRDKRCGRLRGAPHPGAVSVGTGSLHICPPHGSRHPGGSALSPVTRAPITDG